MKKLEKRDGNPVYKTIIYIVCIFLTVLSLFPFIVMVVNSTRNTPQIQQHAVSLIPPIIWHRTGLYSTGKHLTRSAASSTP